MATNKEGGITDETLDQLLAGRDPATVFEIFPASRARHVVGIYMIMSIPGILRFLYRHRVAASASLLPHLPRSRLVPPKSDRKARNNAGLSNHANHRKGSCG